MTMTKKLPFSKMLWRLRKPFLAMFLVLLLSPIILFIMDRAKEIILDLNNTKRLVQKTMKTHGEHEKGVGCKMPHLDPFAIDNTKLRDSLPTINCKGTDWVSCYKSECSVSKEILKTVKDIDCFYRDINYVDDKNFYVGYPTKVPGNKKFLLNQSDHVKIDCTGKEVNRPDVHTCWSGSKAGFRPIEIERNPPDREDSYNVMILCLDSISRIGFIRKMQNSYKYLTNKLNAVILNSYNVVGDGTTGALYPLLTGKPEEDLIYTKKRATRKKFIDPKKFIFHMLKKYGYRTAYFEDMPWTGSTQYKFNWFKSQPADHYLRTLLLSDVHGDTWHQGLPLKHCIGDKPQYQLVMDLADEFLQLNGKKFCFTIIVDMEYANFTVLPTADDTLLSFLQTLSSRRTLEDTLVLIMGDHGYKYSSIKNSLQSKLEERLPLMAVLLPEELKKRRPAALKALQNNVDVLTTPFDIHATILDVLDLKNKSKTHRIPGSDLPKAMSLLEPIPKYRTCGDAGVMPHWCACSQWINIPESDPMFLKAANVLAEYIDSISQEQRFKCARRHLLTTEWVIQQDATDHLSKVNYFNIKEFSRMFVHPVSKTLMSLDSYYQAKIIMSPGNSAFEGTMIYSTANDYYMVTHRDISRVNPYDDEAKCVITTHPHLMKYCYCNDRLNDSIVMAGAVTMN